MCWDVASAYPPLHDALGRKTIEIARRHIIAGISHIEFMCGTIDRHAIGHAYLAVGTVCDEAVGDNLACARIYNMVTDGPFIGHITQSVP